MSVAVVQPSRTARARLHPFDARQVQLVDGFWADRIRINRERTIPHGLDQLRAAGNLDNLRLADGYRAAADSAGATLPFLDSDVYKWLEAVGWELARASEPALAAAADEVIGLVAAAQRSDGYLNSYVQTVGGGVPYRDLSWGHELYCLAHLIQAAVAWHRALGDDRLLTIAVRAAEHVPEGLIDGHPNIEMALVELGRVTGDRRHLAMAARMLELRGHGTLPGGERFGAAYWQDHEPVRDAPSVAGHAVRQLYLDCGAVDVAVELGDDRLLGAVRRRWDDMMRTRTYLTGGMGSRHRDEA
ncbi:MAG: beta-L-arabinofuranosidase domain-containing protein, partial [Actinoplanes sp.]